MCAVSSVFIRLLCVLLSALFWNPPFYQRFTKSGLLLWCCWSHRKNMAALKETNTKHLFTLINLRHISGKIICLRLFCRDLNWPGSNPAAFASVPVRLMSRPRRSLGSKLQKLLDFINSLEINQNPNGDQLETNW